MKNLTLILLTFLLACGSAKQEEQQALKDEVMAIHDEVMPKMGELRRARKDLMLQADSLAETNPERAALLDAAAEEIAAASEGMMQWMREYEPEFEGTDEEIVQYLQDQKVAVQKVKDDMMGSLEKGLGALEN